MVKDQLVNNSNDKTKSIWTDQLPKEFAIVSIGVFLLIALMILIYFTRLVRSLIIFEVLFFLPFVLYLLSIFFLKRSNIVFSEYFFITVFIFSVLYQITILMTEVSLSDDIYRFLVEGKAIIYGINPYITSIDNLPEFLIDENVFKVNNASVTSPYPPFALLLFAILYFISSNPFIYRICFSLGFLLSILVCYRILSLNKKWKIVIYAWNPLLHLETANGAHFDGLVVLFVMLALWAISSEKSATAGMFFLVAFLLKYYPIIFVVIYWKQLGKKGSNIFISGLVIYILFILIGSGAVNGLFVYIETWYFNASIFWLLKLLIGSSLLSKILLGIIFMMIMFVIVYYTNKKVISHSNASLIMIGFFLLFQPIFHPWYLFWIFPFVLVSDKLNFSWILLSGLLILSYITYISYDILNVWKESDLVRIVEYIPFYSILILENRRLLKNFLRLSSRKIKSLKRRT